MNILLYDSMWVFTSLSAEETINSITGIVSSYYVRITITIATTTVVVTIVVRYILFFLNNILINW